MNPADSLRDRLLLSMVFIIGALLVLYIGWGEEILRLRAHAYGLGFDHAAAILGACLGIFMLLRARQRGKFDWFEPPVWISINVYCQVVLNIWLLQRDRVPYIPWVLDNLEMIMPQVILLYGLGLAALWVGYTWTYRRFAVQAPMLQFPAGAMRLSRVKIVWAVGWIIGNVAVLTGISGYLATESTVWLNYFYFISFVTGAATVALVIRHFRNPTPAGWYWLALVVISEIAAGLVVGSKHFAVTLLWLIMAIYYATGKLQKRWLVFMFFIVVVLVPVVNKYRVILHLVDPGKGVGISARLEALETVFVESVTQSFSGSIGDTIETFETRQGILLDITASVMTLHPDELPFVGEEMLVSIFPQFIPRAIWPGKPVGSTSLREIGPTYLGMKTEHGLAAIGMVGDAYRAGGWAVVVIWFMAIGALSAFLYLQGPYCGNLPGTVLYISLLTQVLVYDGEITTTIIRLVQFGLFLWMIIRWLLFYPSPTQKSSLITNGYNPGFQEGNI